MALIDDEDAAVWKVGLVPDIRMDLLPLIPLSLFLDITESRRRLEIATYMGR